MISDITSNYRVKKYILDTEDDFNNLRTTDKMGSMAYVIETGTWFILNGEKEWNVFFPYGQITLNQTNNEDTQYD